MTLSDRFTTPHQRPDSLAPDIHLPTQDRVETAPSADHDDHDESHLIRGYD